MKSSSIVICDENNSAKRISGVLSNLGYENFFIASTKKELQNLLTSGQTDLLIVDAECGEKQNCMKESYQFCTDNSIPIVYIIPHSDSGNWLVENAAMLDIYGYLFKPIRERELHLTIEGTLSRHRSKKELERQLNELSVIHDISQAAALIRNIDELLPYITKRICELLKASTAYIALDEPENNLVRIPYWDGQIPNIPFAQMPRKSSLTGKVITKHKTILINENFVNEAKRLKGFFAEEGKIQTPKSWLGVPITAMNETIGAICIQDFEKENAFSQEQANFLSTIAANVAIALSNAKLFTSFQEELVQRTAREAELDETKQKLETLFDLLPVGVSVLDQEKKVVFANPALRNLLGLSPAELSNHNSTKIHYFATNGLPMPESEIACERAFKEKRAIYDVESGVLKGTGKEFTWLSISALPIDLYDWRVIVVASDITQRKNNEDVLRKREAELLEAHKIARMGRWEIDRDSMGMLWSEGVYDVLELDPKSVKPSYDAFISFSHPDDLDKIIQEITQNARERKDSSVTSRLVMPDGRIKWIYQRCHVECDKNGKVIRFVGIIHDITELKLVEEKLNLHSTALDAAANGVMITDNEGVIQWINPAFTEMTGYTLEEAVGNTPRLLKSGVQTKEFYEELWTTISAGNAWHGEMYDRHKDGHLVLIEQYIAPVRDAQKYITHFVVIMIDISDRSEIQQQLKLQSTALEAAGNAIVITNPEGDIKWVNPAFTTLTGYSLSETLGANTRMLKSGAHSDNFYHDLWSTISAGNIWHGEMLNRRKNGEHYQEELTITPVLDEKNKISHFIAIKQDVTERVEAEAKLRQYAEDQAALHAVAAASTSQLEPKELLGTTLDVILAIPHLAVSCGWVLLFDEKSATNTVIASRNVSDELIQAESKAEKGLYPICTDSTQSGNAKIMVSVINVCTRIPEELIQKEGIKTHISIPLKIGEQVLGILKLGWRDSSQYQESYLDVLTSIGEQISLALHHAVLYQDALQINQLKLINQIGREINSSIELDVVFNSMLELVCDAVSGEEGTIMLLETESDDLVVQHAFSHRLERFRGRRVKKGDGFAGQVTKTHETIFVNDVNNNPHWMGEFDSDSDFKTQSILCAPIIDGKTVIGVIEIINSQKGGFTKEDAHLLDAITPIATVAIKNAQLFALTISRVKELDTLNHIALDVTSSLDSQIIISNALQRIQQQFDANYVGLFNWDPDTSTLMLVQMHKDGVLQAVEQQFADDETCVTEVIKSQKAAMKSNLKTDTTTPDKVREFVNCNSGSWMATPLRIAERVIGAIEVTNEKVGFYDRRQLRVLEPIAATISIALENARLYENLKQVLVERERAQAYLIQSEKSAALGRLSATVAHEINNPLQAIQGCLGLFGEEMEGNNRPEKLNRYLKTVEDEIDRIAAIVRRMRDYYRPARTGLQPVNLVTVINSVLELSEKQFQNSEIVVERQWGEQLPLVQANSDHLKQVFLNMIINAIDAMPEGGNLQVTIEPDTIMGEDNTLTDALKATFTDTGHGMPPDVLSRLFEPFHTTKPQGTGLGLYVSHGIIQAHKGKIEVSSQPGIGTTFEIYIPVTKGQQ